MAFAADVDGWVTAQKDRMLAVAKESSSRLNSIVVQNLSGEIVNVQTGFLRASERASTESMPTIDPSAKPKEGASYTLDPAQVELAINGLQLGQTIYFGWTAVYGPYLEYGTDKIPPKGFVRLACAQWPQIVSGVVAEAKALAG